MLGVFQPDDFYHVSLNLSICIGYACDIIMYITSLEDRYVLVVLVWICDQDCYVQNIGFFDVLMLCVRKELVVVIFPEIKLW